MDIKLLLHAKDYIDDLANGIDPLTKEEVPENDIINNVRVSRCLFYVSDILGKIVENGGINNANTLEKTAFDPGQIDKSKIEISSYSVTVSVIAGRINAVKPQYMKKLKVTAITNWLASINALKTVVINGKSKRHVTQSGTELGINEDEYSKEDRNYQRITYNEKAQRFIVDNLDKIVNSGFNA